MNEGEHRLSMRSRHDVRWLVIIMESFGQLSSSASNLVSSHTHTRARVDESEWNSRSLHSNSIHFSTLCSPVSLSV